MALTVVANSSSKQTFGSGSDGWRKQRTMCCLTSWTGTFRRRSGGISGIPLLDL